MDDAGVQRTTVRERRWETAARVWYGAIAVVVAAALVVQIVVLINGGQDANSGASGSSVPLGTRFVQLFSFFTIQSNLFVLGTSIALAVSIRRDGPVWRVLRLDALLGIVITGIVYDFVLARLVHPEGWAFVATLGFHYIAPWATLAGWLVFGPRPRMSWLTGLAAFIWPVLWLVYTFVRGALAGWYPYPFLNVTEIGFADSLRNSLIVLAIGVLLAVVLVLVDRFVPSLVRGRPDSRAGVSAR